MLLTKVCADGGIGRHRRLKISGLKRRVGSSPTPRTMKTSPQDGGFFRGCVDVGLEPNPIRRVREVPVALRRETFTCKLVCKAEVSGLPKVGSSPTPRTMKTSPQDGGFFRGCVRRALESVDAPVMMKVKITVRSIMATKKKQETKQKKNQDVMNKLIAVFAVTALLVFPLGYAVGNSNAGEDDDTTTTQQESHEHADDTMEKSEGHAHAHMPFAVTDTANAPTISDLVVTKDAKSGWNVSFATSNFTFAPQNASGDHVDGEGHAHIYIDDKKITRLYSNNYYIGDLSEGSHTVKVTLNTNDHKDYAVDGNVVEASVIVIDSHHDDESSSHTHSGSTHSH